MPKAAEQQICFQSNNPYESRYPSFRTVSRETLHLIKYLRANNYDVMVFPEDGTKLNYLMQKGVTDFLSDPIFALAVGIPLGIATNLFSSWVYDKWNGLISSDEANVIIEFEENGNKLHYSHSGEQIDDKRFESLLSSLNERANDYQKSSSTHSPYPNRQSPIFLEHTSKIVGWSNGYKRTDVGLKLDDAVITNAEIQAKIESGELSGVSTAGIILDSTCTICDSEYVDCNHIAGNEYDGEVCGARIDRCIIAETSVVKKPVNNLATIKYVNRG